MKFQENKIYSIVLFFEFKLLKLVGLWKTLIAQREEADNVLQLTNNKRGREQNDILAEKGGPRL